MGVLSLGIPHKAKIEIVVEGEDEGTAMDMIVVSIILRLVLPKDKDIKKIK